MNGGIHAAGLWTGLCVILLLVLSGLTSANRRKYKVSLVVGDDPEMISASRAFGNAAEYMPIALIALALMALTGFAPLWIHAVGGSFFVGRVLHAWGMYVTREGKPPAAQRMFGMLLTYIPLLGAAGALIWCFCCGL